MRLALRPLLRGAVLLATLGAVSLRAQSPGLGDGRPFHALVLTTGATTMSVDALNAVLTGARFAGLSNDGISYGASGYHAFGRALIGADVSRTTYGEEGLSNGRSDDLNATQYLATVSYAIVSTGRLSLFPTLGVGAGRFDVTLREPAAAAADGAYADATFAAVVENPGRESTLAGQHLLYSLGGGADFLVTRGAGDRGGVVLGLRAGMFFAPNRTTWSTSGRMVIAGTDASAGGPFLRVVVGIGGR